jgi:hypothetical protein
MILDEDEVFEMTKEIVRMLKKTFELSQKSHRWKSVRLMKEI